MFAKRTAAILVALTLVFLIACSVAPVSTRSAPGGDRTPTTTPIASSASPPGGSSSPKPGEQEAVPPSPAGRPPTASIETKTATTQMAQSSYCWGGTCADYASPESRDDIPSATTEVGETVTFHLGFQPTRVQLYFSGGETVHLESSKDPKWSVDRMGVVSIFATIERGDSSYAVRLEKR